MMDPLFQIKRIGLNIDIISLREILFIPRKLYEYFRKDPVFVQLLILIRDFILIVPLDVSNIYQYYKN